MPNQETDQIMEHQHLIKQKNPKIRAIWNTLAANEMGRLFQGVGKGDDDGQRIKGTNALFFVTSEKVPNKKSKTSVMLEVCVQ